MANITVGELARLAFPAECTLVAGAEGLGRDVSWPALLRTRPPAFQSLKGGELLLISVEHLRLLDPSLSLSRLLQSVARLSVAGALAFGQTDETAQTYANQQSLPLFELPSSVSASEVEKALIRVIVEYRNELHQRAQDLYRRLMELAIEGRGVPAIVSELANATGRTTVLEDDTFHLSQVATPVGCNAPANLRDGLLADRREDILAWVRSTPLSASEPPAAEFRLARARLGRLVAPVITRQGIRGYLSLLDGNGPFGELDRVAIVRGAAACAIELAREQAVEEAAEHAQSTFVDDLLAGRFDSVAAMRARARRLRLDPEAPGVAVAFAVLPEQVGALAAALEREMTSGRLTLLTRVVDNQVAGLLLLRRDTDERALRTTIDELHRRLAARLSGVAVAIGVGRPRDGVEQFTGSHREATGALQLGAQLFGPASITYFADLGIYRLLLALKDTAELRTFYDETLGRLAEYDRRSDGELLRTLEAYFSCHASPTEAAERLHVHRNTLLYRLGRIRAISGLDLDDPETRLALHLALRVRQLLFPSAEPSGRIAGSAS
ncbi:MAG: helix-turn-helix domain-containing protein [Chloroflexi bacterium]|nr:helix-turn-helix domain-containing protein [Chloroflexota bacterium]